MIETRQRTVIHINRPRGSEEGLCTQCRTQVAHFNINSAASILGISETAAFRLADAGQLHSLETSSGSLFICRNSLALVAAQMNNYRNGHENTLTGEEDGKTTK